MNDSGDREMGKLKLVCKKDGPLVKKGQVLAEVERRNTVEEDKLRLWGSVMKRWNLGYEEDE